jgi:hypothetical protein
MLRIRDRVMLRIRDHVMLRIRDHVMLRIRDHVMLRTGLGPRVMLVIFHCFPLRVIARLSLSPRTIQTG